MSRVMRKLFAYALSKAKIITAQLISHCVIFLNPKFQASYHLLAVKPGLCRTWSELTKTGFLRRISNDLEKRHNGL